jgi:hypothetical protein
MTLPAKNRLFPGYWHLEPVVPTKKIIIRGSLLRHRVVASTWFK